MTEKEKRGGCRCPYARITKANDGFEFYGCAKMKRKPVWDIKPEECPVEVRNED